MPSLANTRIEFPFNKKFFRNIIDSSARISCGSTYIKSVVSASISSLIYYKIPFSILSFIKSTVYFDFNLLIILLNSICVLDKSLVPIESIFSFILISFALDSFFLFSFLLLYIYTVYEISKKVSKNQFLKNQLEPAFFTRLILSV